MTTTAPTRADLPPALQRALDLAVDAKAAAPVVLQLTEIAGYTDWALIVSGRSDRHVGGISDAIMAGLKDMGVVPTGTDGLEEHLWDLLDYDDFLIHVFYHPVRKHYDLESMWRDAPRAELALPAEVMDTSALEGLQPPVDMPPFRGSFAALPGELDDEAAAGPGELAFDDEDDEGAYAGDEDGDEDEVAGEEDVEDDADAFDDEDYDYGGDDEDDEEVDELAAEPPPPAAQRRK